MNALLVFPWSVDRPGSEDVAEAIKNPGDRHFEARVQYKPWYYLCAREWRDLTDATGTRHRGRGCDDEGRNP